MGKKTFDFNIHQDSCILPLAKEKLDVLPLLILQASYYFSRHGGDGLMVELDYFRGLFQP